MATLQNKLDDLEARLKAENESSKRDKMPINLANMPTASPRRPKPFEFGGLNNRPSLGGDSGLAVPTRRKNFQLPCSPHSPMAHKPPDAAEIEQKYQEIMKQTGILNINGRKFHADISELEAVRELGHGTCGHVVCMKHTKTGHLMAVKQMRRSGNREENKRIIMDLDVVLKSLDCPYIVECLGTFVTSSDVWICMELMATCLEKLMKKLKAAIPENILGKVAVATVSALHYLKEEHGVIHRDVKPSNILVDERGKIKLCDFGISGRLVDSKAKTRSAGCAAYMAPERIDPPDPTRPDYDIRADVWSLGISLVELATGEFPYRNCKTDFEVLTKVLQEDPPLLPPGRGFTMDFCAFVRDCLTKDYKKRPKYRKLLDSRFIRRYRELNVDVAAWYSAVMTQVAGKNQAQKNPNSALWTPSPSPIDAKNPFWSPSPNTPTPLSQSKDFFITKPWTPSPSPAGEPQGRPWGTSSSPSPAGDVQSRPWGAAFPTADTQSRSWGASVSPNDAPMRPWGASASPSPHDSQGRMWNTGNPAPTPSPSDLINRQWGPSSQGLMDGQNRPWNTSATPSPSPSPGPTDITMRPTGTPSPSPMEMHRQWTTSSPSPADVHNRQWVLSSRVTPSPNSANMNTWPLPASLHNEFQARQWNTHNPSPSPSPSPIDANMRQWSGSPSPMDIQSRNWVTSPPNSAQQLHSRQWPNNVLNRQMSQGSNSSTDSLTQNFAQFGQFGGSTQMMGPVMQQQQQQPQPVMGQLSNQMDTYLGSQIGLAGLRKPWMAQAQNIQQQGDLFMSRSWSPAPNNDSPQSRNLYTKPTFGN